MLAKKNIKKNHFLYDAETCTFPGPARTVTVPGSPLAKQCAVSAEGADIIGAGNLVVKGSALGVLMSNDALSPWGAIVTL